MSGEHRRTAKRTEERVDIIELFFRDHLQLKRAVVVENEQLLKKNEQFCEQNKKLAEESESFASKVEFLQTELSQSQTFSRQEIE